MRNCLKCGISKAPNNFNFRNKATGRRQSWCRECQKAYKAAHYLNNKAAYLAKASRNNKTHRKRLRRRLLEYLMTHPCVDCGESDPVVLDFDHVRGIKRDHVTKLVAQMAGWKTITDEISKCVVRCANCHRRKTAKQFGSYRLTVVNN